MSSSNPKPKEIEKEPEIKRNKFQELESFWRKTIENPRLRGLLKKLSKE